MTPRRTRYRLAPAVLLIAWPWAMAAADEPDGAALFKKACGVCHASDKDAGPRQGPNLFGIFGRPAGIYPGFDYSPAFRAASGGLTWDQAALDRWLTDPQAMIPGSVMLYKQPAPERRAAVIKYLMTLK